jgi:Holliday junction resolvase RusA-like endonuclease
MQLALNAQAIEFVIPGKPVAWQRVRAMSRFDKGPRFFTADETRSYQSLVKLACQERMNGTPMIEGPVALEVTVTVEIPASWSQKKQAEARHGERMPTGKPDLDNVVKSIKDALNLVAYRDDAQVCFEALTKEYGVMPQVRVRLATLAAKGNK